MPHEETIEKVNPEHIEAVHACYQTCQMTIKHCLKMGGEFIAAKHLTLLMDCAGICHLHEDMLLRGSHHHHAICKGCGEICEECALACEAFVGQQAMAACAQACRRCTEVCTMM